MAAVKVHLKTKGRSVLPHSTRPRFRGIVWASIPWQGGTLQRPCIHKIDQGKTSIVLQTMGAASGCSGSLLCVQPGSRGGPDRICLRAARIGPHVGTAGDWRGAGPDQAGELSALFSRAGQKKRQK